ncbi:MAG: tetratricopeptide repeat protein [Betaproteobacteria bacterium]|nr:tetratricopeptide repeat protein [Betaproteobacteria bacterium]
MPSLTPDPATDTGASEPENTASETENPPAVPEEVTRNDPARPVTPPSPDANRARRVAPSPASPAHKTAGVRRPAGASASTPRRTGPERIPARTPTAVADAHERVRFRRTEAGDVTARQLDDAYASLRKGRIGDAKDTYERVLAKDPRNIDALLGDAAVQWHEGQSKLAAETYYKVLELDPENAAAQAGLIGLVGQVDPIASESRLKQLIARNPSGFLYTALGNAYAEQGRWPVAQQAYFQAFQLDPANPDCAFNLAVGLDRIGQSKIALSYYRQALDLARAKGYAGFDTHQAAARIERIERAVE